MEAVLLDELIEKVVSLKSEERQKLIRALQEEERKIIAINDYDGKLYLSRYESE